MNAAFRAKRQVWHWCVLFPHEQHTLPRQSPRVFLKQLFLSTDAELASQLPSLAPPSADFHYCKDDELLDPR